MPQKLKWNKAHTKIAVYSTISEGFLTRYYKPEDLAKDIGYGDLVKRVIYRICPCCDQKILTPVDKRWFVDERI